MKHLDQKGNGSLLFGDTKIQYFFLNHLFHFIHLAAECYHLQGLGIFFPSRFMKIHLPFSFAFTTPSQMLLTSS